MTGGLELSAPISEEMKTNDKPAVEIEEISTDENNKTSSDEEKLPEIGNVMDDSTTALAKLNTHDVFGARMSKKLPWCRIAEGNHKMGGDDGDNYPAENRIWVKQVLNRGAIWELFLDCEAKNTYKVYPYSDGYNGTAIYTLTEESGFIERFCIGPNRSLTFRLREGDGKDGRVVVSFKKNIDCLQLFPCMCISACRPNFTVYRGETDEIIGTINDPFACCNITQYVKDSNDNENMRLNGYCCQIGLCCPAWQCMCPIHFGLYKPEAGVLGSEVGNVRKEAGGITECICSINKFTVQFPEGCTSDEKHMLMGTAMLLDMAYFEPRELPGTQLLHFFG